MKSLKLFFPLACIFYLVQSHTTHKKNSQADDGLWSGEISFVQATFDTVHGTHYCGWENDTSWSEWRMEADIVNNKGTARSSTSHRLRGSGYDSCVNARGMIRDSCNGTGQDQTELDLGIDEGTKEYGFTVNIPPCTGMGIKISYRNGIAGTPMPSPCGQSDSQIFVDKQKMGTNRNILSGTIVYDTLQAPGSRFMQIWKWRLVRKK
jgi:hypothetical protein